jgi:glycolate oxidase FAD binding subunit
MKIVRADGSLIKVGGRVVKNVAGYDLSKLFTGSYGTLGVIVEVNFKLRPAPFQTRTVVALGERDHLLNSARSVIAAKLFPVAVEILSPMLARPEGGTGRDHALLMKFDGSQNGVDYQATTASDIIGASHISEIVANDDSQWRSLAALPLKYQGNIVSRVSVRPADIEGVVSMLGNGDFGDAQMWHASMGLGRVRVIDRGTADTAIAQVRSLRAAAQKLGGTLVIEEAALETKQQLGAWGDLGHADGLMQRLKQQLDPNRILSPGRFSEII